MLSSVALPSGFALNEYRIESTLGVGGFGVTYLARDANLDLRVAIKEYMPGDLALRNADHSVSVKSDQARDTFRWGRERFLEESRTLASFKHDNIVRVMRFFEANQTAYMVMEFVAGMPLNDWVAARRPPSQEAILKLALPLLDGLEVVHRGGYLHRDIKPANIFIRDDGRPVLIDFGSARATRGSPDLTAIVTPGYAPLEQYHAQGNQGPWSDLYSVGAVLYWLVTGQKPLEAAARARSDPLVPALEAGDRRRYSEALLRAVDWALAPAEEQRPQSAARLKEALLRVSGPAGSEAPTVLADAPAATGQPVQSPPLSTLVFDQATLDAVSNALAQHIGPIARAVVRAAARKSIGLAQLAETAGAEIDDAAARAAFVRQFVDAGRASGSSSRPVSRPTPTPQPVSQPVVSAPVSRPASQPSSQPVSGSLPPQPASALARFDPDLLARLETALADEMGAMARVVVRRAASRARDEAELFLLVADEIEDPAIRRKITRMAVSAARRT
ncbi:MAG: protein kinase [Burkholderiales bacterium]|nr:protein kinase [Burkholderiales bacterium]